MHQQWPKIRFDSNVAFNLDIENMCFVENGTFNLASNVIGVSWSSTRYAPY